MKTKSFQGSVPGLPPRLSKLLSAPQGTGANESLSGTLGLFGKIQQPSQKALGQNGSSNPGDELWFPCRLQKPPGAPGGERPPGPGYA